MNANRHLIGKYLILDKESEEYFMIIAERKTDEFPSLKPYVDAGGAIEYAPITVRPEIFDRLVCGGDLCEHARPE